MPHPQSFLLQAVVSTAVAVAVAVAVAYPPPYPPDPPEPPPSQEVTVQVSVKVGRPEVHGDVWMTVVVAVADAGPVTVAVDTDVTVVVATFPPVITVKVDVRVMVSAAEPGRVMVWGIVIVEVRPGPSIVLVIVETTVVGVEPPGTETVIVLVMVSAGPPG